MASLSFNIPQFSVGKKRKIMKDKLDDIGRFVQFYMISFIGIFHAVTHELWLMASENVSFFILNDFLFFPFQNNNKNICIEWEIISNLSLSCVNQPRMIKFSPAEEAL